MTLIRPNTAIYTPAGADVSASRGTLINTGSPGNNKGAWSTLIDPIPKAFHSIYLLSDNVSATAKYSIDIALGDTGGGNEKIMIADLWGNTKIPVGGWTIRLPLGGPAGKSLRVRGQSSSSNRSIGVQCILEHGSMSWMPRPFGIAETYGFDSSSTKCVTVDPGGAANTKSSSWIEIVASTGHPSLCWLLGAGLDTASTVLPATIRWAIDVAIGGAGSEKIIANNLLFASNSSTDRVDWPFIGPFYVPIPAGSRISVKAQCTSTDATYRVLNVFIMGVR